VPHLEIDNDIFVLYSITISLSLTHWSWARGHLLITYLKYQIRSTYSVYEMMQILEISAFAKTPINGIPTKTQIKQYVKEQLNIFNFNEILKHQ
jgi:hypothetical protein